jgi:hypothetical protein
MRLTITRCALPVLMAAAPVSARADDWAGVGIFLLGIFLAPVTVIALLLAALALVPRMSGAIYVAATVVFFPAAWWGCAFFGGEIPFVLLGISTPSASDISGAFPLSYYYAIAVSAVVCIAYGAITARYWKRFFGIGPRVD